MPSNATPNNLTNVIRNPDTFYYGVATLYDWFARSSPDQNNDLWSGGDLTLVTHAPKSVFDPCPIGWRTPPFLNGTSPFAKMESGSTWDNTKCACIWPGIGGYFSGSGYRYRDTGLIYNVGVRGAYWSGAGSEGYGYNLDIQSSGVRTDVLSRRAYASQLRCCRDNL